MIAIYTHAVKATRVSDLENEGEPTFNLPPKCIKRFVRKVQGIQNIWQPFPSFGGSIAEEDTAYRIRVSERLRHKQRLVTMLDIEQFILNEFPQILMVKCLGSGEQDQSTASGVNLQVILIPKEQADGRFISDEPKVSLATLYQVRQSLLPILSPFIKVEVGNPVYEKVKVVCKVKFVGTPGFDQGFYVQELNRDIKKYICSWLYESSVPIKIGTTLYLSDMYNYIKNLDYISVVTGFSMVHFFEVRNRRTGEKKAAIIDSAVDKVEFIRGSTLEAVLIPDSTHIITVLEDFEYEEPSETGIGNL
ncbi:MAG: hypothetical protein ACRDE2_17785, partial [Chitinophagaceae bacterium]